MAAPVGGILGSNEEEAIQVKDEAVRDVNTRDGYEHTEWMYTEIMGGTPKSESRAIRNKEDADLWDEIAADVADIVARGHMPIYGYSSDDD